ncbi:MAG: ATP-binding protein [Campylobacterota bacterium]|nr:ATP-binding protein [Campylobacterota bacterium]
MQDKFKQLKNRGLFATIVLVTFLSVLFLYVTINEKRSSIDKELLYKKNQLELVYMKYIEQLKLKYSNKLRVLLKDKDVIEAFAKRDRKDLNKLIQPYFEKLKKDEPNFEIICFSLPSNKAFLRAHRPDIHGDDISKVQGVQIVNDKKVEVGGFMLTKLGLYYRVNSPVFYNNKHIGLVSYGINIGAVNDYVSHKFNSDVAILIDTKKYKNFPWFDNVEEGSIGDQTIITSTDDFIEENSNLLNIKTQTKKVIIDEKQYFVHKDNSIYDLHNNKIATILLLQDITHIQNNFISQIIAYSLLAILLIIIISIILTNIFNKMINKIINMNTELHELNQSLEEKVYNRTLDLEKQTKKANDAEKAKGEFLANMSHEIRTPLNAILGFVGLLKESEKDKERSQYLTTVDKSSHSLLSIINDILDFSKIESGKIDIENIDFDSFEEFETTAELFKAKSKEKGVELVVNIHKDIPKYLHNDIQKIRQVISNLLSNAIKFTPKDKKVELEISYSDENLHISVKDQGIGIPKNKQTNIFEAFSQADASTTRKFGGTGLGLSISNAFVKLLGSELKLESIENKGSRFYFSIPCNEGKKTQKQNSLSNDLKLTGTILVVEDNKANQMFMKVILKKIDLQFDIANDGLEAIDMFKNKKYDIILMDENMPNMNGIEATHHILKYEKENNLIHTPIVALTANALKGDKERFIEAGMDEYLSKPLDKDKLSEVLIKLL